MKKSIEHEKQKVMLQNEALKLKSQITTLQRKNDLHLSEMEKCNSEAILVESLLKEQELLTQKKVELVNSKIEEENKAIDLVESLLISQTSKTQAAETALQKLTQEKTAEITALRLEHARQEAENLRLLAERAMPGTVKEDYAALTAMINSSVLLRTQICMQLSKTILAAEKIKRITNSLTK